MKKEKEIIKKENILTTEYSDEMQQSYLNYSMSVITSRAIPDIRDGLKPVQRRVLYDMNELGVHYNKPTLKSARICGDTMGKYHPHGDSSIYETLVVLAQGFKRMMPLVKGQGNFGSIEGDTPAAQRYTEAKLQKFTDDVFLSDLDKTVKFMPNYDEKLTEPTVLPCRIPNFLLNGAEGIAVGMATNSPTHNLGEICDLIIAYLKNKNISLKQMMKYLKGPDFPTGGIIANSNELLNIYKTGIGKLRLRGKIDFENANKSKDKDKLVISEIPYTMIGDGIGKFMSDVGSLCENKKINDITDIYNHSDESGIRIVLELKPGADYKKIINILYKKTKLEDTFGVNMLAIVDGRPETMTLKSIIENYISFQYSIIESKYKNLLEKENINKEIQEGLIKACDLIDAIIAMLRSSKTREDAKTYLMTGKCKNVSIKDKKLSKIASTFKFTERQANSILDMRLYKLIGLEINDLNSEYKNTLSKIKKYKEILKSKEKVDNLIIDDISNIKKEYAVPRKTSLENHEEIIIEEEKKESIDVIYVQDKFGYAKLFDTYYYDKNKESIDIEYKYIYKASTSDKAYIFSTKGMMYTLKLDDVPMCKIKDKGKPIDNMTRFDSSTENIVSTYIDKDINNQYFFMCTKDGLIKYVDTKEYEEATRSMKATKLNDKDELVSCILTYGDLDVIIRTNDNYVLRLNPKDLPELGKTTKGVKGINLSKGDFVVGCYLYNDNMSIKINDKNVLLNNIKRSSRASKGSKLKI